MLGSRAGTTLSLRLAARVWQLVAPHRAGGRGRVVAAVLWAAADVALVRRLRCGPEPSVVARLVLDAVDTAFWTAAARGSPDHMGVAIVPALALCYERSFLDRRRAWVAPLLTTLATEASRLASGDPPKPDRLVGPVMMALPGLALGLLDRADRRTAQALGGEIQARAAEAAEAALTEVSTSTDSLADIIRDVAHKLQLHGGPRAERNLVERWKEQRAEWIGAAGYSYLATVLRTWENTQSHPDLGTHVRFTVPPADGLALLDPDQQRALLDGLDERRLAGDVAVSTRPRGRRGDLDVTVGPTLLVLRASGRLPPRPLDYTATTQGMTSLLTLVPLLRGQGRVAWWAAVPPALVTGTQCVLAARRTRASPPTAVRRQVAVSTFALAWHAVTAAHTQREHAADGGGPVRAPFYLAISGQATLLTLEWARLPTVDRIATAVVTAGAGVLAVAALPPRSRVRLLLADLCWSAAAAGLMHSVARSAEHVEEVLGLEDDAVDAAVGRARLEAAAFFGARIISLTAVTENRTLDADLAARIAELLEEARKRCENLRRPRSSSSTTTRPNGPDAVSYWPSAGSGSSRGSPRRRR